MGPGQRVVTNAISSPKSRNFDRICCIHKASNKGYFSSTTGNNSHSDFTGPLHPVGIPGFWRESRHGRSAGSCKSHARNAPRAYALCPKVDLFDTTQSCAGVTDRHTDSNARGTICRYTFKGHRRPLKIGILYQNVNKISMYDIEILNFEVP